MGRVTCEARVTLYPIKTYINLKRKYMMFVSTYIWPKSLSLRYISNWVIWVICQSRVSVAFYQNEILKKIIWWNIWQCQWWYLKLRCRNLIWFVDFLMFCVLFWILLFCWKELGGNLRGRERSGLIWIDLHLPAVARHSACWAVVGDAVVDVVEAGGVLALLLLLHPLCILRRNKGGGVTRLDREGGGLRLGGDWNCKVKQYWQPLIRATMKIMNH